jgi:hypothetical protein
LCTFSEKAVALGSFGGVPGGIRTHDPLLRRHFLKLIFVNKFTEWLLKSFGYSPLS